MTSGSKDKPPFLANVTGPKGTLSADWEAEWCCWVLRAGQFERAAPVDFAAERERRRAEETQPSDEIIYRAAIRSAQRRRGSESRRDRPQTIAGLAPRRQTVGRRLGFDGR